MTRLIHFWIFSQEKLHIGLLCDVNGLAALFLQLIHEDDQKEFSADTGLF